MRIRGVFRPFVSVFFSAMVAATVSAIPSDVFVVWDVSGSMRSGGVARDVKSYIRKEVIDSILKPGDRFSLIVFGSDARQLLSRTIETEADKAAIAKEIETVKTDDAYTDLGIALEKLDAALSSSKDGSRRPLAVFITDGKNAPPPSSPYSGKDLSVDVRFKDIGRRIAMKGWNLYVIGVGDKTDAPAVAAAVEGSKLAEAKDALKAESLSTYVKEADKTAEDRAAAAAKEKTAAGTAGAEPGTAAGSGSFPVAALIVVAAAAIAAALFFAFRSRRKKDVDDDKDAP